MREGTAYLGRVLLSQTIQPNEWPNLCVQACGPLKEPKQGNFLLWVDLYEWIGNDYATPLTDNLWVEVTIGELKQEEPKIGKYRKKTKSWTFVDPKCDTMTMELPVDYKQIPDIIINFYTNSGDEWKRRIGYLRINPADVSSKSAKP